MELIGWLRAQWDRVAAWVVIAAGAVALLLGWWGVSGSGFPAQQIPYVISGGMVGLFLVGLGGMLWLSADLRDEWRKLDAIERTLDADAARARPVDPQEPIAPATPAETITNGSRPPRRRPVRAST